jgi:DNA-damage-inducible protein J
MTGNSVVRARIDERTKREAAAALKRIGLTVSDAFRLLLVRIAAEKALPFEPLNPNAETVAAMKAARRGELVKVGKPGKLLRSLNARRRRAAAAPEFRSPTVRRMERSPRLPHQLGPGSLRFEGDS